MFDLMDKDKGGSLGAEEIKQLMDMLGMKVRAARGHLWWPVHGVHGPKAA